ncbi:predicted GPI-anchored protein 58 [Humulus lupulus]|uniref:predicted GPI-anchored protein 58 n=1 Tax=Humulus lupulus TaxID=3486 RepID=UPI002B413462|nr:predicted GPI-anchored protein 58 [Humulus lupulus]
MELRSALLASMTDAEKSVENLVTEVNLRMVGLWAPQPDTRGPSAGSACAKEEPEQQPPASPPRRRLTGVTTREPADMDSTNVFDLYNAPEAATAPPSKKKTNKRHLGESSKAPQAKKACNAGPSEDIPSATTTPPSPREQQTPSAVAGSTPSPAAPTDQPQ